MKVTKTDKLTYLNQEKSAMKYQLKVWKNQHNDTEIMICRNVIKIIDNIIKDVNNVK